MALSAASIYCLLLATLANGQPTPSETFTHTTVLKQDKVILHWKISSPEVVFEIHAKTNGWIGIGLSPNGAMAHSDIHLGWVKDGKAVVTDRHGPDRGNGFPPKDAEQNIDIILAQECDGWTLIKFKRELAACEERDDREITDSTMRLIWAYGAGDPTGDDITTGDLHSTDNRGVKSIHFLKPAGFGDDCDLPEGPEYETFDVVTEDLAVPAADTYYNCRLFKMPEVDSKRHVVKFEPVITPGNEAHVHHILIYQCDSSVQESAQVGTDVSCYGPNMARVRRCQTVIAGWAVGGSSRCLPPETGMSFGSGGSDPVYIELEIHYDNPDRKAGIVDSSGIRFVYTSTLRTHDTGVLIVGFPVIPYTITIPPDAESYTSVGFCAANCSRNAMEEKGIDSVTIYGAGPHTHLAGRGVKLRHFRDGQEKPPIMDDDSYDFNYQELRMLQRPVEFASTDVLRMECVYNTKGRTQVTQAGFSTTDEMCLGFVWYYPKIDLGVCFSFPDLSTFGFFGIEQAVPTTTPQDRVETFIVRKPDSLAGKSVLDVLSNYSWNEAKLDEYSEFVLTRKHTQVCVKHSTNIPVAEPFYAPVINSAYEAQTKSCVKSADTLSQMRPVTACGSAMGLYQTSVSRVMLFIPVLLVKLLHDMQSV